MHRQEAVCSTCGTMWDPDACPDCQGYAMEPVPRNVILYRTFRRWKPMHGWCAACELRSLWRSRVETCPHCGSDDYGPEYPEIPDLSDEPGIALMLHAEGRIPRDERGALLPLEMQAWLTLHGVPDRREQLLWEEWFLVIGGIRAQIEAEVREEAMPDSPGASRDDDRDGDEG